MVEPFLENPPQVEMLTDYDRSHLKLYIQVLDAAADNANWREVVRILFERDPNQDPEGAKRMYDNHLARAKWMTETGYRHLLREA